MKKFGFTLAEVLITLGIIGVVAALTIPTLVANYQNKAWNTSAQVFERKLEEALKTMNTQQVLAGYSNTADFVAALGKYFKITKVCANNDIMSCFEDKVTWGVDNEEIDMSKIKKAKHFGQDDWDTELIGVQFGNGTSGIIAYNPECKEQPFTNQFTGTSCLALLYDIDGFKKPNTQSKDLRSINVLSLGNIDCVVELSDGTCFTTGFKPEPLTYDECMANKDKWGILECNPKNTDYWGGAVKVCGGADKLPTENQLVKFAEYLYNTSLPSNACENGLSLDKTKLSETGLTTEYSGTSFERFYLYANNEGESYKGYNGIYYRTFEINRTCRVQNYNGRNSSDVQAICLAD